MTTYTRIIPCTVTFTSNPEEPATEYEPKVEGEFIVESFMMGNCDIMCLIDSGRYASLDAKVEKYLMENSDEC